MPELSIENYNGIPVRVVNTEIGHPSVLPHPALKNDYMQCPYCLSEDVVSGSYRYYSDGTRQPSFTCRDCNHNFSFDSYAKPGLVDGRANNLLEDLKYYGLIEEPRDGFYKITNLGIDLINERKTNSIDKLDALLLNTEPWKTIIGLIPLHPTRQMFFSAVDRVDGLDAIQSQKEWLWRRFNKEILPALERVAERNKLKVLINISLLPNREMR